MTGDDLLLVVLLCSLAPGLTLFFIGAAAIYLRWLAIRLGVTQEGDES